jgi:hypothetical protein
MITGGSEQNASQSMKKDGSLRRGRGMMGIGFQREPKRLRFQFALSTPAAHSISIFQPFYSSVSKVNLSPTESPFAPTKLILFNIDSSWGYIMEVQSDQRQGGHSRTGLPYPDVVVSAPSGEFAIPSLAVQAEHDLSSSLKDSLNFQVESDYRDGQSNPADFDARKHLEDEPADMYLEKNVFPVLLPALEKLLAKIKRKDGGSLDEESVADPINWLAQVRSSSICH